MTAESPPTVHVRPGQTFEVELESAATGGYEWQLARALDERVVNLIHHTYVAPDPRQRGTPGREVWTFRAVAPGASEISLAYVRPLLGSHQAPEANRTILVVVEDE
jgi:inhibitor of cysteine peptidase